MARRIVIIGGVAGGMSAATRLRRLDERAEIIVLERGEHVSFANCGLPYHLSGIIEDRSALLLQTPQALAARFNLDVRVNSEATAIDPQRRTVSVAAHCGEYQLDYDELILAPGASPVRPALIGQEQILTLRNIADVDAIMARLQTAPASAVIIGAGFIGLEVAENLVARGLKVSIVELGRRVLPVMDPELSAMVAQRLRDNGVSLHLGASLAEIGANQARLETGETIPADLVIAAIGVRPDSNLAQVAGVAVDERGAILVDDHQRTSVAHIYAVGDAAVKKDAISKQTTFVPLAQTANRHGRLVADVICGREAAAKPVLGTAVVEIFGLSVATTGWGEQRARANGRQITVIHTHPLNHAGYYPGAAQLALKLIVDSQTQQILGAQGVGESGVDKRIDVIATAMRAGLEASELADLELAYAPQFGSAKDPVNMLGFIAENIASGLSSTVQFHELEAAMAKGATLVDVRTAAEFAAGTIPGAVNIPVDELRARIGEIPPGEVIVHCQVGIRGHIAAQILSGHGIRAANLDGGYLTWTWANRS